MRKTRASAALLLLPGLLAAFLFITGCGAQSPGEMVERHLELLDQRQFDEFYEMHAEGYLPDKESFITAVEDSFPQGAEISDIEIIEETVDGNEATVEVSYTLRLPGSEDQELQTTVRLVKQNGIWKISEGI